VRWERGENRRSKKQAFLARFPVAEELYPCPWRAAHEQSLEAFTILKGVRDEKRKIIDVMRNMSTQPQLRA
jgi:hypothetical protein